MFLGVSTLLVTDGTTTILTDGFFSRPGLLRVRAGRVRPRPKVIAAALERFGVRQVDVLVVLHSHFDHALDSADVALRTGARVTGSGSTRNVVLGHGLPGDRFEIARPSRPVVAGAFTFTLHPALHSPGDLAPGTVDGPLRPGARATAYRTGDCFTLQVEHPQGALLVQASANTLPGALDGVRADTVHLGTGTLGKQDDTFLDTYWRQHVTAVGARRVVPIHWDNFTVGLERPLVPFPAFFDDFTRTMEFLVERGAREGVEVMLPVLGRRVDPFRA